MIKKIAIAIVLVFGMTHFASADLILTGTEVYISVSPDAIFSGIAPTTPPQGFEGMEYPFNAGGGAHAFGCSGACVVDGVFDLDPYDSFSPNYPIRWIVGWDSDGSSCSDVVYDVSFGCEYYAWLYVDSNGDWSYDGSSSLLPSTSISIPIPAGGSVVSTTTDVGGTYYIDSVDSEGENFTLHIDFSQDSAFACMNAINVGDIVNQYGFTNCGGENTPAHPFSVDFSHMSDDYEHEVFVEKIFTSVGKWTGVFSLRRETTPWYYFGLYSTFDVLYSTTTHFLVSTSSPMDIIREVTASSSNAINKITRQGIAGILASTTASLKSACNIIGSGFSIGDCLTLIVYPGDDAIAEHYYILKQTPPWGYVFRVIDILRDTPATTTMPTIAYDFASTSPMSAIGTIHFDPFDLITQSGELISEMHSDRASGATVWTILMPVVTIIVYLALFMMIIHDLTGIHSHSQENKRNEDNKKT